MSYLPARPSDFQRGGINNRDGRALERHTSGVLAQTAGSIAAIDGAGDIWSEVLTENTRLTGLAMRGALEVGQAEVIGTQMMPHIGHRLTYLADEHAQSGAVILGGARRALGRLAQAALAWPWSLLAGSCCSHWFA